MKKKAKNIFTLVLALVLSFTMLMPTYASSNTQAEIQASALKQLRLFKGVSANNFDLDRAPTRTEAMIMLISILGQQSKAANGSWTHPFTDVASWADKYIGYAYENGLTKGMSATEYGSGNADSDMYLTFMLRTLGYSDSAGDFSWDAPDTLASSCGILPSGLNSQNFMRADAVLVSWAALKAKMKDGSQTLSEKLMDMGAFNSEEYKAATLFADENGGVVVSDFAGFETAVNNENVKVIQIASDIDIPGELFVDRENGPETLIYVKEGVTLTIGGEFTTVGCFVTNDGTISISGTFDRGISNFTNNGTVTVKNGGTFASGMSDTYNYGTISTDNGGNLSIDRGTQFHNYGNIKNNGYTYIDNGGSLFNGTGKIANDGTMDIVSYFSGDTAGITGSGTVNDKR
ncbi:MAG: hypothetical protein VB120_05995 [Lachnospiraceae bacterium]|nr:hypothetical protein [Lachnospiraceae bacterium]